MRILAFDTTSHFGSIAVAEDDLILEEIPIEAPEGFSQILLERIQRPLRRLNWPLDSIDVFAAAAGPGSFTGLRIGLAAAKGLAFACGRKAIGISNLEALACMGSQPLRAAVIDARRGEVYGAVFDASGNVVLPESVAPMDRWLETVPAGTAEFLSTGLEVLLVQVRNTPWTSARWVERRQIAAAVASVAFRKISAGDPGDPAVVDANYVRRSDAKLLWKDGN